MTQTAKVIGIVGTVLTILGIVLGDFVSALITASTQNLDGGPTLARVGRLGAFVSVMVRLRLFVGRPRACTAPTSRLAFRP